MDEVLKKERRRQAAALDQVRRRRILALRNKVRNLSDDEAFDLRQLNMMLGRSISEKNKLAFLELGLAKQTLGGQGVGLTELGRIVLTKYPSRF